MSCNLNASSSREAWTVLNKYLAGRVGCMPGVEHCDRKVFKHEEPEWQHAEAGLECWAAHQRSLRFLRLDYALNTAVFTTFPWEGLLESVFRASGSSWKGQVRIETLGIVHGAVDTAASGFMICSNLHSCNSDSQCNP